VLEFPDSVTDTMSVPYDGKLDFKQSATIIPGISCFYQNPTNVDTSPVTSRTYVLSAYKFPAEQHLITIQVTNQYYYGRFFGIKYPSGWWTVYGDANQGAPYTNGTPTFISFVEGTGPSIYMMRDSYFNK